MKRKPLQIQFSNADRSADGGDSNLYSFAEIPSMDEADEDYTLFLTVKAADTKQEQLIADTCIRAINAAHDALTAMQEAYAKLDSVAFMQNEGDTDDVKQALADAIAALTAA